MRRLELRSFQSPGDILMMTAATRDLHLACPGQFLTDVRTSADALWENNPYITRFNEGEPGVEVINMHYGLINSCNNRPYHFIHGYVHFLEQYLNIRIALTQFHGDIHLSPLEKSSTPLNGFDLPEWYWIIVAGGKYDFTAKWWNPDSYQMVVDHFRGRIVFVQVGERGHWHLPLRGVIDLVGKTGTRDFVRLMFHSAGVVCPVTFAMHLAAAVETRPDRPRVRPCVVIAGAREPTQWEAYPHHQYLSTLGMLSCGETACWKSRCQLVGDGDAKDRQDLCEQPVQITPSLRIPRCMDMITADDVIRKIELYLSGVHEPRNGKHEHGQPLSVLVPSRVVIPAQPAENGPAPPHVIAARAAAGVRAGPREPSILDAQYPLDTLKHNGTPNTLHSPKVDTKMDDTQLEIEWLVMPGLAEEISLSPEGRAWCLGIGTTDEGYSIHAWGDRDWDHIAGGAIKIAAAPDNVLWTIDLSNQIKVRRGGQWELLPGLAREIAVGADGSAWCISVADFAPGGGSIHHWTGSDWSHVDGAAVKIAVGPDGRPWIANSAGQIFQKSSEGWQLMPGLAGEISISADGAVWCLSYHQSEDGNRSIHRWNGNDWDTIPGGASKIAAGTAGQVLVSNAEHTIFRLHRSHKTADV